jgi:hypothetical protein
MLYSPTAIPCYEQPERCFIASPDGYYVSCNKRGAVSVLDNQQKVPGRDETWFPLSVGSRNGSASSSVVFQSFAHGHYLCVVNGNENEKKNGEAKATIQTCPELGQAAAWAVRRTGSFNQHQDTEVMLQCHMGQLILEQSKLLCRHGGLGDHMGFGWKLEAHTGELCFLHSPKYDDQLVMCRPGGGLELSRKWGGWEVWRFVEAGGSNGEVYLTSWTHTTKVLKANKDGTVVTTENRNDAGTRWIVYRNKPVVKKNLEEIEDDFVSVDKSHGEDGDESSQSQSQTAGVDGMTIFLSDGTSIYRRSNPVAEVNPADGVVIQLSGTDSVLCTDGEALQCKLRQETTHGTGEDQLDYIWHLEAAHRQRFFLSTAVERSTQVKHVGNSNNQRSGAGGLLKIRWNKPDPKVPFLSSSRGAQQQWEPIVDDEDMMLLRNCETGKYLGSLSGGEVLAVSSPGDGEKWIKGAPPSSSTVAGAVMLISYKYGRKLTWNLKENTLTTKADVESDCERTTYWQISPAMPSSMSAEQRRKLIIAGSVAAAVVVVAPFAAAGVVAAIGFGAEGIAAGSMAAGMMSAEAVAAGTGAVVAGGTVATLQSVGAAGLGVMGTTAALGGGAVVGGTIFGTTAALTHRHQTQTVINGTRAEETELGGRDTRTMNRPFAAWKSW